MKKFFNNAAYLPIILILAITWACSTEKNSLLTRGYHNLTANYNIFFNGDESYKKGIKKQEQSFEDNYSMILPLFKYSNEEIASSIAPDMERAIKKASKLISVHSITAKPERKSGKLTQRQKDFYKKSEYNKWVDDSYLLIGKANFQKMDYQAAENTFNFITQDFKDQAIKYDAQLWLLRVYIETKDFEKAGKLFDKLNSDRKFPKKLKGEFNAVYADFYMKQELYSQAISKLENAIEKTKKRKVKIRYIFILAQLYEETNMPKESAEQYEIVIRMNPHYEMIFNAKLNRASLLDYGSGKSREVKKELLKMLKDVKNKEYLDQIYYVLGQIELKAGNQKLAIDYFKKSATSSVFNNTQKVMSYLQLAELYFAMPDYQNAKLYYDSSVTAITPDYPNYEEIIVNTKNLNALVTNLNIVAYEDSLQKVAKMPEKEREKLIESLIKQAKEEERRQEELLEQQKNQPHYDQYSMNQYKQNVTQGGKWYFYNPSSISFGQNEFERLWGKRKLEDHWRRKNKQAISSMDEFADAEESDSLETTSNKDKYKKTDKKYYLEDLPLTEAKMEQSNKKVEEALFDAAKVYQDKLEDVEQAETTYENQIQRYPDGENAIFAYYNLYNINKDQEDLVKMDYYKNIILRKFPGTNYVNILTNPDYINEVIAEEQRLENFYQQTYDYYQNGEYQKVMDNYFYADTGFQDTTLMPNFTFLYACAIGYTQSRRDFKASLEDLIAKYPDTDVENTAKEMIFIIEDFAFKDKEALAAVAEEQAAAEAAVAATDKIYTYKEDTTHFFIIVAKTNIDLNQLKFNVTGFIVDYYDYDDFDVADEFYSDRNHLVVVREFENQKAALDFYRKANADEQIFKDFAFSDYKTFIISVGNLQILKKDKDLDLYKAFFEKNYY